MRLYHSRTEHKVLIFFCDRGTNVGAGRLNGPKTVREHFLTSVTRSNTDVGYAVSVLNTLSTLKVCQTLSTVILPFESASGSIKWPRHGYELVFLPARPLTLPHLVGIASGTSVMWRRGAS